MSDDDLDYEDDDEPRKGRRRRRRRDDDDDYEPAPKSSSAPLVFTIVAVVFLVLCCITGILASLLLPALTKVREKANRTKCANNLRQIGFASIAYMTYSSGPHSRKGFMPHVSDVGSYDGPDQVGNAFELLIHTGEIDDTEVFICPSGTSIPNRIDLGMSLEEFRFDDPDVRTSFEFDYGWSREQRTDGNSRASTIISADRYLGMENHPDGRNLLRFDGSVDFVPADIIDDTSFMADQQLLEELDKLNLADRNR